MADVLVQMNRLVDICRQAGALRLGKQQGQQSARQVHAAEDDEWELRADTSMLSIHNETHINQLSPLLTIN